MSLAQDATAMTAARHSSFAKRQAIADARSTIRPIARLTVDA